MKACSKCGEEKPLDEFYKDKRNKDGRQSHCKACFRAYQAGWRAQPENKERQARYLAEYIGEYLTRPEVQDRRTKYSAEYRAANRERLREQDAEYRENNPHIHWAATYRYRAQNYGLVPVVETFTRDELVAQWGDSCIDCGKAWDQVEHVVPVSDGGEHSLENCRPICEADNRRRWAEYKNQMERN